MAQGDITLFHDGLKSALESWITTDVIKCAVLDGTTAPTAADVDPVLLDYTEVGTGGTYVAGGISLGTWGDFITQTLGTILFDTTINPSWAQDAGNDTDARWLLIYNDTQTGNPAFAFGDLGADFDMTAAPLTINWPAGGIATLSQSA